MSGIMTLMLGGGGSVQSGPFNGGSLTFNADGSTSDPPRTPAAWFLPPEGGIGSSYWIRLTRNAGSSTGGVTFSQTAGVWLALSAGLTISATGGAGHARGTIEFATDSGGVNIVASDSISVDNAI